MSPEMSMITLLNLNSLLKGFFEVNRRVDILLQTKGAVGSWRYHFFHFRNRAGMFPLMSAEQHWSIKAGDVARLNQSLKEKSQTNIPLVFSVKPFMRPQDPQDGINYVILFF